ncbi:hypothetical protein PsorP6_004153 [Peronosclerospora sorghi]|uniref:Uncharacterized protein n=1 Tax=Peronosclerospora sorghi TaxID=230839 RepID=A0ACC0VJM6_9STRA|nr:hypothetical protein PsorP6_004153 [Peronosclerospora sorghi]
MSPVASEEQTLLSFVISKCFSTRNLELPNVAYCHVCLNAVVPGLIAGKHCNHGVKVIPNT